MAVKPLPELFHPSSAPVEKGLRDRPFVVRRRVKFPRLPPLARAARSLALILFLCMGCEGYPPSGDESSDAPSHVIFIVVDTWRADHFLSEKAGVDLTPRLRNLSESSVVFSANSSVGAVTSAGVAGLMTGLLPYRSGVIANEHIMPSDIPYLPELLAKQGFRTGAFVANPVLAPGFGFERGFEVYRHVRERHPFWKTKAHQVNREALAWIDERHPSDRLFVWLHYMEPHGPYEPPEEATSLFTLEQFDAPRNIPLLPKGNNSGRHGIPHYQRVGSGITSGDGREYALRYAAEVRSLDDELASLLEELERRDLLQDSLLVIAADHGEALAGDHGFFFSHDHGLTEDQIHVPLLLYSRNLTARKIAHPTSNIDVLPTLLGILDLPAPTQIDGRNVLEGPPNWVAGETTRERAVRRGPWKLRLIRREKKLSLVNLEQDPLESDDLIAVQPRVFEELRALMRDVFDGTSLAAPVNRNRLSDEERERLRTLGYL